MNPGLELGLILLAIVGAPAAGLAITAAWGAGEASRAEERSRSYMRPEDVVPLTESQQKRLQPRDPWVTDDFVADFIIVRDEFGNERIVPVSPPEAAEGGSPTAS